MRGNGIRRVGVGSVNGERLLGHVDEFKEKKGDAGVFLQVGILFTLSLFDTISKQIGVTVNKGLCHEASLLSDASE